jgi:hypothetical protein
MDRGTRAQVALEDRSSIDTSCMSFVDQKLGISLTLVHLDVHCIPTPTQRYAELRCSCHFWTDQGPEAFQNHKRLSLGFEQVSI